MTVIVECQCTPRLIGELSSSLCASSLKNLSTVSGSHSLSEAVLLVSLSLLRLICSLHNKHLLLIRIDINSAYSNIKHINARYIIPDGARFVKTKCEYFYFFYIIQLTHGRVRAQLNI